MSKWRKVLLMTVILVMSFSTTVFGMGGNSSLPVLKQQKPVLNVPERLIDPADPNELVRIMVELESAPTIEKATQKGVLYKQLNSSERESLEAVVTDEQVDVQAQINKAVPTIDYLESFTTVFNGFSAEVEAKFVEKISATAGVKAVYESTEYDRPEIQPQMTYSKELVQAQKAWNSYEFKGEGMVVGIIDTGIDPSHKDMVLTDDAKGAIKKEDVDKLLAEKAIEDGKYFTAKVPFGYNYMDGNQQILDLGPEASMHGMHVGGTVAANGDEEGETFGIKGVAPEAQLLALKVFGNDPLFPSTFGDIYVKAIDDAIKLGVDVINMSLGSTAGYVDANNPEQQAVKRATENGVLVAISAGNSALFGDGYFYPYAENQDYGLTGSPSVSFDSLGVASLENDKITADSFNYQVNGEESGKGLYLLANDKNPTTIFEGPIEVVDAGFGNPADFAGKDYTGKIALISRGVISFVEKGLNAQAAGAAGVIIYNNAAGTINMVSDPAIKIPYMSSLQEHGKTIKAQLDAKNTVTVSFEGNFIEIPNPAKGKMSAFTSWGPTPNLDFKPEITAPGGNIFSTLNDDKYGLMSGTSMAAPHVAGGTALIFNRVDSKFDITGIERVQLAKNLLMNTAKPVELVPGEYVSPRRQGSGLMQLANALATNVVVTNKATGEAKVALKEIKNNNITFKLLAKNYSDTEKTYNVDVAVQTDEPIKTSGYDVVVPNIVGSNVVTDDVDITAPKTITLAANEEVELEVTIDVSSLSDDAKYKVFKNGYFIDGFVKLVDPNEDAAENVPLTVPFFGFNGGWDDASIFDYFAWEGLNYWGMTALADEQGNFIDGGGTFNTERFGFSPNADGVRDKVIPVFSLLRNAKEFKVQVLDEKGKVVRTIRTAKDLTKHYISTRSYTYSTSYAWDGNINGKPAADGNYFIQLSGVIDFEGAEWQSIQYPVKVDKVAPTADVEFDEETKTVTVANLKDSEGGTGVDYWQVVLNGESLAELTTKDTEFEVDAALTNKDKLKVIAWDAAGNSTEKSIAIEKEEADHPVIFIESPGFFDYYNTSEVEVIGSVADASDIKSLTVNGEKATFDGVNFSHTLTLEDGVQNIKVAAIDNYGNEMEIARKIFVDTQAPKVTVKTNYPSTTEADTVKVTVNVEDNFDELRLYVNGDERFSKAISEPYAMNGFKQDIEVELALVDGVNEFKIEVEDLVGHKTTETIKINKSDVEVENPTPPVTTPVTPPVTPPTQPGDVVLDIQDILKQLADPATKEVKVTAPALTKEKPELKATVPATELQAIATSGKAVVISSGDVAVTVPSQVLKDLVKNNPGTTSFSLKLGSDAKIPGNGTQVSEAYSLAITVEKDGKTTEVTKFAKPVQVTVPVKSVKDANKVAAYYVNEKTKALEYVNSKYTNGKVTFKTNHFSTFVVVENNKTFKDVKGSFAKDFIESLASKSIISGTSETTFGPNDQITRAQFAVLLSRALDLPKAEYQGVFADVSASMKWSAQEIEAANRAGIIEGSGGKFNPNDKITREQMATMIVRAIKYNDASVLKASKAKFADSGSISGYAKESVGAAAELGIINGKVVNGKSVFAPKDFATRAEAAKMLYKLLENL